MSLESLCCTKSSWMIQLRMHCPAGDEDLADDEEEEEAFNDEMDLVMVSTHPWIAVDLQKEVH